MLIIILLYCTCIVLGEDKCKNQKYRLIGHLSGEFKLLELDYLGTNQILIHWSHLLEDTTIGKQIKVVNIHDLLLIYYT